MLIQDLTNDSVQAIYDAEKKITLGRNSSIINTEIKGNLGLDDWSEIRHSILGRHIGIGSFSSISGVNMGNFCTISARVALGRSEHPTNWLSVCKFQYRDTTSSRHESLPSKYRFHWDSSKRTTVGSDAWISDSAIIKKAFIFPMARSSEQDQSSPRIRLPTQLLLATQPNQLGSGLQIQLSKDF